MRTKPVSGHSSWQAENKSSFDGTITTKVHLKKRLSDQLSWEMNAQVDVKILCITILVVKEDLEDQ